MITTDFVTVFVSYQVFSCDMQSIVFSRESDAHRETINSIKNIKAESLSHGMWPHVSIILGEVGNIIFIEETQTVIYLN